MEIGVELREEAERAQRIAERERDAAIARAEQAERRLDEAVKALRALQEIANFVIPHDDADCRLDLEDAVHRAREALASVASQPAAQPEDGAA